MTGTLADFWSALCPALPAVWDTPSLRERLERTAERMAPIPRVALECRLGAATPRVDLQQCVVRDGDEPALLRDFLSGSAGGGGSGLGDFCEAWANPASRLHRAVAEVFLEYDLDGAAAPAPSVFFALDGDEAAAREALAILLVGAAAPAALGRCFAACPAGARIAYVGVMLGRPAPTVRVNVKRLDLDELGSFLEAIGWGGPMAEVTRRAAWAYDGFEWVTVCLDVEGDRVHPHLGLECGLALQPSAEPRWASALQELQADPESARAFLAVPGTLAPMDCPAPWPGPWIAESLAGPAGRFSTTERRLSHVKLTVSDAKVPLKGYWGAGHVWRDPGAQPGGAVRERPSAPAAVADAATFLLARQSHTGRWSDFLLPAGPSDEWVTAFVATCLLESGASLAEPAARRAWSALATRRRDEPGWGYNRLTPADADSTAWALRLAARLGVDGGERAANALAFLERHVVEGGGITTYAARDPIRAYTRLPEGASLAGWRAAHACVTAAAAPLVGEGAGRHLTAMQSDDGSLTGYWWPDDAYTTALAAEAVPACRERAVAWALAQVGAGGEVRGADGEPSAWAASWCVRLLRLSPSAPPIDGRRRVAQWLLRSQLDDGSWPGTARMRVPMPADLDPGREPTRLGSLDGNRIFTTAAVAAALGGA